MKKKCDTDMETCARVVKSNSVVRTSEDREAFRRYWSRRLVVVFRKERLRLIIERQRNRSPRFLKIFELASKVAWSDSVLPGGSLDEILLRLTFPPLSILKTFLVM
mmetsp:Transcript_41835/g.57048  ORF Transcript_41835/g.57048 Transcript_41835/m.57048 type:complete len:106 (-) Transcript_41835:344-661(-)